MRARNKIALMVVGLVVVLGGGTLLYLDGIAKGVIEKSSERALGVSTSVGGVRLGLIGDFGVSSYHVKNPEGFEAEHLFRLDRVDLSVGMKSVLKDTVVIKELILEGIALELEMVDGKTNYGAVLENMKGMSRKDTQGPQKHLIIENLIIRDITARAKLAVLGSEKVVTAEVPEIRMQGVGRKQGGVYVSELVSIVMARVVDSVLREGVDFPGQLRAALDGQVKGLLREHRGQMDGVSLSSGDDAVEKAKDEVVDKAKDAVKWLLGGDN